MTVRVMMFAAARELAGGNELLVDVGDAATLADVERAILDKLPALRGVLGHARWAVDREFASDSTAVTASSEIALIPPVSGG